jgi:serine/threonine protein kinase
MQSAPNPLYRLVHKDYFEHFDAYHPSLSDFHDLVSANLGEGWEIHRTDLWFHCNLPQNITPGQGWKIHISATLGNAKTTVERVTEVLARCKDTNFKFALDLPTLSLLNSKQWPRGASGKFITIYPPNSHRFLELIEVLHQTTKGLRGPYIFSDYRYPNSEVVFYRYGGMQLYKVLNVEGERTPMLVGPDGSEIPDQRLAYPITPPWADPLLPAGATDDGPCESCSIGQGRYTIQNAIKFSNSGGVYQALDNQTGSKVIIKEARPCISETHDGYDAVKLLKKEYSLLCLLADTGIAPKALDLFPEWEHWFLVEEYIDGVSMSGHSAARNILLRTRPTEQDSLEWYQTFRSLCMSLIGIVETLHAKNIVFTDLSPENLIVCRGTAELKLIDFEGAYQIDVDPPTRLHTPGFISSRCLAGAIAGFDDDYYALGAVLLAYLFPVNGLFHLEPAAKQRILAALQADIHLPEQIARMILDLTSEDLSARPTPAEMRKIVETSSCSKSTEHRKQGIEIYHEVVTGIASHIEATATYQRADRLFPGDPKLFTTNPLNLAYGAAGVAYAMDRITDSTSTATIDWILRHKASSDRYAPGLYIGLSGIAWSLLELGVRPEAEKMFRLTFEHPLLYRAADVFYGVAGWGMTCLRFFLETGNELYLAKATEAGDYLLNARATSERGCYWEHAGAPRLGMAHGASGAGLFLLYLFLATGEEHFLATGQQALEFDLSFAVGTKDGGLSWGSSADEQSPLYPYWRFGSAGIGKVALRFEALLGEGRYRSPLEKIFIDTDRKYAVLPGQFMGLAGLGGFLLDMHQFFPEDKYLNSARKVADGIMHFRVDRQGSAFPGAMLSRLSCDYGTGSSGVALFLNRLLGRQGDDFMLDSLFAFKGLALRRDVLKEETSKSALV